MPAGPAAIIYCREHKAPRRCTGAPLHVCIVVARRDRRTRAARRGLGGGGGLAYTPPGSFLGTGVDRSGRLNSELPSLGESFINITWNNG
jgi:hypothetical protein